MEAASSHLKQRAGRFPIRAPLRYREYGKPAWHEGVAVNISRSGVLFNADRDLASHTLVEIEIVFTPEMTGGKATHVLCWGPVVRRGVVPPQQNHMLMAASFSRYRFVPS